MIRQGTLTLKMTIAQVVETSVTVNNNSPIQDYIHPNNQTQPTFIHVISIFLYVEMMRRLQIDTDLTFFERQNTAGVTEKLWMPSMK